MQLLRRVSQRIENVSENYFFFSSIFVSSFRSKSSWNFSANIFTNCSASLGIVRVRVLFFISCGKICLNRNSCIASIFSSSFSTSLFIL